MPHTNLVMTIKIGTRVMTIKIGTRVIAVVDYGQPNGWYGTAGKARLFST